MDTLPSELLTHVGSFLSVSDVNRIASALKDSEFHQSKYCEAFRRKCIKENRWQVKERLPLKFKNNTDDEPFYNEPNVRKVARGDPLTHYNNLILAFPSEEDLKDLPFVSELVIYCNYWDPKNWEYIANIADSLEFLAIYLMIMNVPAFFSNYVDMQIFSNLRGLQICIHSGCEEVLYNTLFSVKPILECSNLTFLSFVVPRFMFWFDVEDIFGLSKLTFLEVSGSSVRSKIPKFSQVLTDLWISMAPEEYRCFRDHVNFHTYSNLRFVSKDPNLTLYEAFPKSLKTLFVQGRMFNLEEMKYALKNNNNVEIIVDSSGTVISQGEFIEPVMFHLGTINSVLTNNNKVVPYDLAIFGSAKYIWKLQEVFYYFNITSCSTLKRMHELMKNPKPYFVRLSCHCCSGCGPCLDHRKKNEIPTFVREFSLTPDQIDFYGEVKVDTLEDLSDDDSIFDSIFDTDDDLALSSDDESDISNVEIEPDNNL